MNERQAALFQPTGELARHVFLVRAGQGKDHPPMATLKIALPHAAAFPLEQMFLRATEAEEIRVAWNNDLTVGRERMARIGFDDIVYQTPVFFVIHRRSRRIELRVVEELSGSKRHDETMMRVIGSG